MDKLLNNKWFQIITGFLCLSPFVGLVLWFFITTWPGCLKGLLELGTILAISGSFLFGLVQLIKGFSK